MQLRSHLGGLDIDMLFRFHVLDDIQPYVCICPECDCSSMTFSSKTKLLRHEESSHGLSCGSGGNFGSKCLFCDEHFKSVSDHFHHCCRHMEEVAFAVVAKPYEDWSFYSDSRSGSSDKVAEDLKPSLGVTCGQLKLSSGRRCGAILSSALYSGGHDNGSPPKNFACLPCFKEAESRGEVHLDFRGRFLHTDNNTPWFFSQCPKCDLWIQCLFINDTQLHLMRHAIDDRPGTPIPNDADLM